MVKYCKPLMKYDTLVPFALTIDLTYSGWALSANGAGADANRMGFQRVFKLHGTRDL